MTDAMKYWVSEANVDGYRCDVAGFVPTDFWNNVRKELDAIRMEVDRVLGPAQPTATGSGPRR